MAISKAPKTTAVLVKRQKCQRGKLAFDNLFLQNSDERCDFEKAFPLLLKDGAARSQQVRIKFV